MYSACVSSGSSRWRLPFWVLLLSLVLLSACGGDPTSPEQQIEHLVDAMEQAVEAGSISDAAEFIDTDYRDARHRSKREAVATLFAYMRRHRQIHLFTVIREVRVDANQTTAATTVYVAMSGRPIESVESLVSVKADLYRFDIELALRDDDWRVTGGKWQRADLSVL